MPEPIPDTPGNIARALLNTPPKKKGEWRFMQNEEPSDNGDLGL